MSYKGMSDEELIKAYYECNNEAFEELYHRYIARLKQFFIKARLGQQGAEDMAQDTIVRVMETKTTPCKQYSQSRGASFKTWLFTIAYHLLVDKLRRQEIEISFGDLEVEGEEGEEPFEELIPSVEPTPEEKSLSQELRQAVHDCMTRLPDRERIAIALWLETGGDMKLQDLAGILSVSVPTAYRVLKRALSLMRKCLKERVL